MLPTLRNHTVHFYLFFNSYFYLPCRTDGTLSSLTAMANLQILDLAGNYFQNFKSFEILKNLKNLKILQLKGNPCCLKMNFPSEIFKILNQVETIDQWYVFFHLFISLFHFPFYFVLFSVFCFLFLFLSFFSSLFFFFFHFFHSYHFIFFSSFYVYFYR